MLGIKRKAQPKKEPDKDFLEEQFPFEKNLPDAPAGKDFNEPEPLNTPPPAETQEPEPPFASWNDDFSDEEMPLPPPVHAEEAPEKKPVRKMPVKKEPFKQPALKGPVFLSLGKYHEVKKMLFDLKKSSAELRTIISDLKKNRDGGTDLLEQSVERLSTIEMRLEEISITIRA